MWSAFLVDPWLYYEKRFSGVKIPVVECVTSFFNDPSGGGTPKMG